MTSKSLGWFVVLLTVVSVSATMAGQSNRPVGANPQSAPVSPTPAAAAPATTNGSAANPAITPGQIPQSNCINGCDYQPSHIAISTPAPAAAPWPWQERIAWGANIVLVFLAYVGIMMALSTLRKIERQTRYSEETSQAALESAQTSLSYAQAMVRAERPWVLVAAEPSVTHENAFTIVAINRGRTPAKIETSVHEIASAADENVLPKAPELWHVKQSPPQDAVILLPGESLTITAFSREGVKDFCKSEERLKQVEEWEEKIYLYGKITYRDLIAPSEAQVHSTAWCYWYIHGRQKSGMVTAGPPAYNQHT